MLQHSVGLGIRDERRPHLLELMEKNRHLAMDFIRTQNWNEAWRQLGAYPPQLLQALSYNHPSEAAALANTYAYVMMEVGEDLGAAYGLARWALNLCTRDRVRAILKTCIGLIEWKRGHFNTSITMLEEARHLHPVGLAQAQISYNIVQSLADGYLYGGEAGDDHDEGISDDAFNRALFYVNNAIDLFKQHGNGTVPKENRYHFSRAVNTLQRTLAQSNAGTAKADQERLSTMLDAFGSALL